jgi:hypothetical protein
VRLIALLLTFLLAATGALAQSCPQGSAYADGCATSPGGTFQFASYAAYSAAARQSGQTWTAAREPWNICGVDYACGPYTARSAMLVPGVNALPSGCGLSPQTGGTGTRVLCANSPGSLNLTGWDFHPLSGPYAGQCLTVVINSNAVTAPGATLTLADNHHQLDNQCTETGTSGQLLTILSPAPGGVLRESNEFDGNCSTQGTRVQSSLVVDSRANGNGADVREYEYIHDACGRPENETYNSQEKFWSIYVNNCQECSNVLVGCPVFGNGFHGESNQLFVSTVGASIGSPIHIPLVQVQFNVDLQPNNFQGAAWTAPEFFAGFATVIDSLVVTNNSFIDNTSVTGGANNVAAGLLELGVNQVTAATIKANYVDTTGVVGAAPAKACLVLGAASRGLPGSISGTTLTITSGWTLSEGLIWPGGVIYGGTGQGAAYPVVEPYGTAGTSGVGGAGTYALSTSATSSGSYTEATVVLSLDEGTGGAPAAGGTNNWSLTSNTAITGYTIAGNTGSPSCS